jgi:3-oxoacyl-(acyl-carrier-protein) synthase
MSPRRVWITGLGAVSAAGTGAPALLALLQSGRSAVRPSEDLAGWPAAAAPTPATSRAYRRLDRAAALFGAAGEEAWRDAGLPESPDDADRFAIIEGSSLGSLADLLEAHRARLAEDRDRPPRPSSILRFMSGAGGAVLAQAHGVHGAVLHLSAGSVSATCAIGEAWAKVASGMSDVVVAGGAECPLHPEILAVFRAAGILADARHADCRPFDARRCGTVLGEGAAALVLEAEGHARQRGARPRATITGFGLTCEAYALAAPEPSGVGVARAVRQALGGRSSEEIGWIKAHGTGTHANDLAESLGLAAVFGGRLAELPVTSLKSSLGHLLGASGALEAVAVVLAMEHGFVPATVGTDMVDPALPVRRVPAAVESSAADQVLLTSESFGGRCAALTLAAA